MDPTGNLYWTTFDIDFAISRENGLREKLTSTLGTGTYIDLGECGSFTYRIRFTN